MRYRTLLGVVVSFALLSLLLGSCASPPSRDTEAIALLTDYINGATVDELVAQTKVPFLFEDEIILRESQVRSMWANLKSAGLRLEHPTAEPTWLHAEDFILLGDTLDLRRFFDRLSSDATMVGVGSNSGNLWLLLSGKNADFAFVQGIGRAE